MRIDIGLSPLEMLCALGGVIGFFAALVQIWEFVEKRPHLRRLLLGWTRAIVALAALSLVVAALVVFAPRLQGEPNPPAEPMKPAEDPIPRPPAVAEFKGITRWVVVVPNNMAAKPYQKICDAAGTWGRVVRDDDLVSMVNFSDRGPVFPLKDLPGKLARADLPERVAMIPLIPRGSIEEAVRKADDFLGRATGDRREIVVILSGTDPRGYVEADRPSSVPTGGADPRQSR